MEGLNEILLKSGSASRRISWGSWDDTDPDTLRVIEYAKTLVTGHINEYAVSIAILGLY